MTKEVAFEVYQNLASKYGTRTFIYDMSKKPISLNDQKPKPRLGNDPNLHGKVNTDMPGGSEPSKNRPIKPTK